MILRLKGVLLTSLSLALLAGCAGETAEQQEAVDAETTTAETQPTALSVEEVQGTWALTAYGEAGDSLVSYTMNATGDPSTWTLAFPDMEPVPVRDVTLAGDSMVMDVGPYSSALREGVQVTTRVVARLEGDRMTGHFTARYQTTEPDSVVRGRFEGTRQE